MAPENGYYRLGQDSAASGRLTLQHYLIKDLLGFNLHPSITATWLSDPQAPQTWTSEAPATPSPPRRIADVACGNGIWSVDLLTSPSRPSQPLQITAFDLLPSKFPPKHTWPTHLTFETWDIYTAPTPEHTGVYDVVYLRLLISVVPNGNPAQIIDNCMKLLKPGGHLQWVEFDLNDSIAGNPCQRAGEAMARRGLHNHEWVAELDTWFAKQGMVENSKTRYLPRPEVRKFWSDNFLMAMEEVRAAFSDEEMNSEYTALANAAEESDGFVIWATILAVGRKAL